MSAGPAAPRGRADFAAATFVFLVAAAVYLASAPRTVVLDDDGYFLLAAFFNGVAHPPGYPLYTQIAHLATLLPLGTVAFRVHALSGLLAAAACVCVFSMARALGQERLYAATSSLCFAFSAVFWSQAIVAEVYALHVLVLFGMAAWALRLRPERTKAATVAGISLLWGLALANHWPLALLSTPMLACLLWPVREDFRRHGARGLAAAALGLTPYLWMIARSHSSEIAFNGPIESISDFWFYVSREGYADVDWSPNAQWADRLRYAGFVVAELARQFGPFGIFFAVAGFACQWQTWPRHVCVGLMFGLLCNTLLLAGTLGFEYDLLHRHTFSVYPIAGYGVAALWLGLGVERISGLSGRWARPAFTGPLLAMMLTVTTLLMNSDNYRPEDVFAEEHARAMLETLPRNAVLFVQGDYATGPVGYLNRVEGVRSDVRLYNDRGQVFSNRLYRAYDPDSREIRRALDEFMMASAEPVYYSMSLPHTFGREFYGLYTRVLSGRSARTERAVLDPRVAGYMEAVLAAGAPADGAELVQYRQTEALYCRLLALLEKHDADGTPVLRQSLELRCAGLHGLLHRALVMMEEPDPEPAQALKLLEQALSYKDQAVVRETLAMLDYAQGRALELEGKHDSAAAHFENSIRQWPAPVNPARARRTH